MKQKLSHQEWIAIGRLAGWMKHAHQAQPHSPGNSPDVYELLLHITNEPDLYKRTINPTIKNMAKKIKNNIFNRDLALKQFAKIASGKENLQSFFAKIGLCGWLLRFANGLGNLGEQINVGLLTIFMSIDDFNDFT
jgi:hypothetical protein